MSPCAESKAAVKKPCTCNGKKDIVGSGGKCQDGPNGAWCYVNEDAGCDNKQPYNGKHLSVAPCTGFKPTPPPTTTRPCVCNGMKDFLGFGGKCQEGPNGAWCYVNENAGCDNKQVYNGKHLSTLPCTGFQPPPTRLQVPARQFIQQTSKLTQDQVISGK